MDLVQWFDRGLTEEEYINSMQHNKESMLNIKEQVTLQSVDKAQSLSDRNLKAIVLTADWCGDAMVNIPIFMEIAKAANIEIRYLIRDENLELMDQYLTNGTARSIPIIVLFNEQGNEYAKWGPRAKKVQAIIDEFKDKLPPKEDPSYETAFKEHIRLISAFFTTDTSIWSTIEEDMLNTFVK